MKNIRNTNSCFSAEPIDLAHHLRQCSARNHAILHDVIWRDATHRGEGSLATLPYKRALRFGLRNANLRGSVFATDFVDMFHQRFDFSKRSVEFHEQERSA